MKSKKPTAILWDYDGTLMDSANKNFSVNREIFHQIKPRVAANGWPKALSSLAEYKTAVSHTLNWQRFYMDNLGYTHEETLQAGSMWSEYNLANETKITLFEGISNVVQGFKSIPQGICSLNCADNIAKALQNNKLNHYFSSIVGFNTISHDRAKPYPDAFLHCLNDMSIITNGTICYIGDHEDDAKFARNAETSLREANKDTKVIMIAAAYGGANPSLWETKPDYIAHSVTEIKTFVSNMLKNYTS